MALLRALLLSSALARWAAPVGLAAGVHLAAFWVVLGPGGAPDAAPRAGSATMQIGAEPAFEAPESAEFRVSGPLAAEGRQRAAGPTPALPVRGFGGEDLPPQSLRASAGCGASLTPATSVLLRKRRNELVGSRPVGTCPARQECLAHHFVPSLPQQDTSPRFPDLSRPAASGARRLAARAEADAADGPLASSFALAETAATCPASEEVPADCRHPEGNSCGNVHQEFFGAPIADGAGSGAPGDVANVDGAGSGAPGHVGDADAAGSGAPGHVADADGAMLLSGKPIYPAACRRGECRGGEPCEGVSRWRIVVPAPGSAPTRIEMLSSAGCARLDQSVREFLTGARVPKAGVLVLRFRFELKK
jgi:hypothetical protein